MADNEGTPARSLTRRQLIKRAAVMGGAAVWATPIIRMAVAGNAATGASRTLIEPRLVAFDGSCGPFLLADPTTTRTVCASTQKKAEIAFKSEVKTDCRAACQTHGPCTAPSLCNTDERTPADLGVVTCVGSGLACASAPYGEDGQQWICTAVVACNCVCG